MTADQTQLIPSAEIPTRIPGTALTVAQLPIPTTEGPAMPTTTVVHEDGRRCKPYVGLTPREAVIAGFAQLVKQDFNTWSYDADYGHLVRERDGRLYIGVISAVPETTD